MSGSYRLNGPSPLRGGGDQSLGIAAIGVAFDYQQVWNIVNLYGDVLIARPPPPPRALIVWGAQDRIYSVEGASTLARALPGSELHVLADAGHLLHVEHAGTAAGLLVDWLRRSPNIRVPERPPRW